MTDPGTGMGDVSRPLGRESTSQTLPSPNASPQLLDSVVPGVVGGTTNSIAEANKGAALTPRAEWQEKHERFNKMATLHLLV